MRTAAVIAFALAACSTPSSPVAVSGSTTTTVRIPVTDPAPRQTTTTTTTAPEPEVLAAAATPPTAAPVSGPCGGWRDLIAAHFPAGQVAKSCQVMMCESNGNPTARNPSSSAAGLFQFLLSTHKAYGDYPTYPTAADAPPASQVAAAARLYRELGWRPWVCA